MISSVIFLSIAGPVIGVLCAERDRYQTTPRYPVQPNLDSYPRTDDYPVTESFSKSGPSYASSGEDKAAVIYSYKEYEPTYKESSNEDSSDEPIQEESEPSSGETSQEAPRSTYEQSSQGEYGPSSGETSQEAPRSTYEQSSQGEYGPSSGETSQEAPRSTYEQSSQGEYGPSSGETSQEAPRSTYEQSSQGEYGPSSGETSQEAPRSTYEKSSQGEYGPSSGETSQEVPRSTYEQSNQDEYGPISEKGDEPRYSQSHYSPSVSSFNPHLDPFTQYPSHPVRNIRREVEDADASVPALNRTNLEFTDSLDIIESKIDKATQYREEFERSVYAKLVASIEGQDQKIDLQRAQLVSLSDVTIDVDGLLREVAALEGELTNIRDRRETIAKSIQQLENVYQRTDLDIAQVTGQGAGDDRPISIIDSVRNRSLARYSTNLNDLIQVVNIVNEEQAESFTVILTDANSSVPITYETPFVRAPQLVWAIVGVDIGRTQKSGYGVGSAGSREDLLQARVEVTGDTRGATVKLEGSGVGWKTESVRVKVLAFSVSDQKIQKSKGYANPNF